MKSKNFSPNSHKSESHIRLLSPGILYWEVETPEHLNLKASRAFFGASQMVLVVKNPPVNVGDSKDMGLLLGLGRSPGVANGTSLQNLCLHGERTLAGFSPWGCKESNKTEYDNRAIFWETQGLWETRDSILKGHTKF